jgi:hypothetical protein
VRKGAGWMDGGRKGERKGVGRSNSAEWDPGSSRLTNPGSDLFGVQVQVHIVALRV